MPQQNSDVFDANAKDLSGLLSALFSDSIVGMCLIDAREPLRIRFANAYLQHIIGHPLPVGEALSEAWPHATSFVAPLVSEVLGTQQARRVEDVALLAQSDAGDALAQRYFALSAQPFHQGLSEMRGVLLLVREDTKSVIARLRVEQERETQTAMFRMLSHDLRNPIGSAKMATDGICRAKDVPEKLANKAKRASQALQRADHMISRFLDLRVLHAGHALPLQRSEGTLAEAVEPVVEEMNLALAGRVTLTVEESAHGLWDPQYMSRALGNLVENAAKYGDAGAPIDVRLARENAHICLDVRNQGASLSPQDIASMMSSTPWRQARGQSSHAGGWGMGLALVRSVAEAHQGQLEIDSRDAHTRMRMRFPIA